MKIPIEEKSGSIEHKNAKIWTSPTNIYYSMDPTKAEPDKEELLSDTTELNHEMAEKSASDCW